MRESVVCVRERESCVGEREGERAYMECMFVFCCVCLFVCVCEREGGIESVCCERERDREREFVYVCVCVCVCVLGG